MKDFTKTVVVVCVFLVSPMLQARDVAQKISDEPLTIISPVAGTLIKTGDTVTVQYDYNQDFRDRAGSVLVDLYTQSNGIKRFPLIPIQNTNKKNFIWFDSSWHKEPRFYIGPKMKIADYPDSFSVVDTNAYIEVWGYWYPASEGGVKQVKVYIGDSSPINKKHEQISVTGNTPFTVYRMGSTLNLLFDHIENRVIHVMNLQGKKLYLLQGNAKSFPIPGLKTGIFIVSIKTRSALTYSKCIVMD